jgi:hypothetical protein
MRYSDLLEGGWASILTQNTKITPVIIAESVEHLKEFEQGYNTWVRTYDPRLQMEIGNPVGSGTYYLRDLKSDPDKEYGDVDVTAYINPIKDSTPNNTVEQFKDAVINFCKINKKYQTDNGTNVIFETSAGHVQIDLIYTFHEFKIWAKALAPEHGVKGAISTSLYSAMAEALNISFGTMGVQVKMRDNKPVSFRQSKDTVQALVTKDPHNWAKDIYKFYYKIKYGKSVDKFPKDLETHSGFKDEQRISDIISALKALVKALNNDKIFNGSELMNNIAQSFVKKMDAQISSSKFDKAATPAAKAKAEKAKATFTGYRDKIPQLLAH